VFRLLLISLAGEEVTADDFTYAMGSRKRGKRASSFMVLLGWLKKKKETVFPNFGTSGNRNQKLF
jgi:hypothetical protein